MLSENERNNGVERPTTPYVTGFVIPTKSAYTYCDASCSNPPYYSMCKFPTLPREPVYGPVDAPILVSAAIAGDDRRVVAAKCESGLCVGRDIWTKGW